MAGLLHFAPLTTVIGRSTVFGRRCNRSVATATHIKGHEMNEREIAHLIEQQHDFERSFPLRSTPCGDCGGKGSSSAYLGSFTRDEFDDVFHDEDYRDDYLSGRLDRACRACDATGSVWTLDIGRAERMAAGDPLMRQMLDELSASLRDEYDFRAMEAAERRMGC